MCRTVSTQNRLVRDYIMDFCNELPRLGHYEIGFREGRVLGGKKARFI